MMHHILVKVLNVSLISKTAFKSVNAQLISFFNVTRIKLIVIVAIGRV